MAKINLLTIHWGNCYGAVLQTYATCKILEELGHKVTVINVIPRHSWKKYLNIKSLAFLWLDFQFYVFKHRFFPKMTHKMHSLKRMSLPKADYTVVGSDQVWNKDITKGLADDFFLLYLEDSDKRFSLASSFGKYAWQESMEYTSHVQQALSKFIAISVRENSGVAICENMFHLNATQLIDPTLAYNNYSRLLKSKREEKCVHSFLYRPTEETKKISMAIADQLGIVLRKRNVIEVLFRSSPRDWLGNICNSQFVITDSFHCLAFCIIFRKQFLIVCGNRAQFTRLESLLTMLGLEDRFLDKYDVNKIKELVHRQIDYDLVAKKLDWEAVKYREFVIKATTNL